MKTRHVIGAVAAATVLVGGGVAAAATTPPQVDGALAGKAAGLSMKAPGRAAAVLAPGRQVRDLVLAGGERDVAAGDPRFGRDLVVVRNDDPSTIDTSLVPVPPGWVVAPQRAVVTVVDPVTGGIVTVIWIGADEAARSERLQLGRFGAGRPVAVDVRAESVRASS